jgi:hypothetical protein
MTSAGSNRCALPEDVRTSEVAKIEAADPSVSTDLLLRALFALGATPRDVASAIRKARPAAA